MLIAQDSLTCTKYIFLFLNICALFRFVINTNLSTYGLNQVSAKHFLFKNSGYKNNVNSKG